MLARIVLVLFATTPASAADLVLVNGKVWTGNPKQPEAEALAIRGDRLVAVLGLRIGAAAAALQAGEIVPVLDGGRVDALHLVRPELGQRPRERNRRHQRRQQRQRPHRLSSFVTASSTSCAFTGFTRYASAPSFSARSRSASADSVVMTTIGSFTVEGTHAR